MSRNRLTIALVGLMVAALGIAFVAGCGPKEVETPKLIVGTSADYAPFEYVDETTGEYVGFDIELMEAIAAKLGMEVEWQDMDFGILLQSLKAGQIDAVIACMTVNEERLLEADFSEPYIISKDAILVQKGSGLVILTEEERAGKTDAELLEPLVAALADLRVAAQSGTIQETWIRENLIDAGLMAESQMSLYPRADQAVADLEAGRVDCIFLDEGVAEGFTATNNVEKALTVDLEGNPGIAVQKGDAELLEKINNAIVELRNEGVITQLAEKYELPGE